LTRMHLHESAYRGADALEKLASIPIAICGAGALGSQLADNLVRQGVRRLTVIDHDRIEPHNVGTQLYGQSDVGGLKAEVLRAHLFRAAGVEITAHAKLLDERTVKKFLRGAALVVDAFDNSASRRLVTEHCREQGLECLHLGMNADYGEVRWNKSTVCPRTWRPRTPARTRWRGT
jgi:molybdopterin-synthase adenylyltransferase